MAGSTVNAPRLRGFAPRGDAFFKDGVEPSPQPLPSSVFSSSRSSFLAVSPVTQAIRSWRYPMKLTSSRRLQRLVSEKVGQPVSQVANLLEVSSRPLPFLSGEAPIRRWSRLLTAKRSPLLQSTCQNDS